MIEILDNNVGDWFLGPWSENEYIISCTLSNGLSFDYIKKELVDALWEVVKYVLEG